LILRILSVALAAWLGGGAVAVGAAHARYGLTPTIAWLAAALALAILVRRSFLPLLALVLLLPWLPLRVPPAFLIWTGHAAAWIGLMIAAALAAPQIVRHLPSDPVRARQVAFALSAGLFLAGAWAASPQLPAGDEPHYLVITQSLLQDHDLQIENNHRQGDYHAYFAGELRPDYLRRGVDEQIYSIHAPGLPAVVAPAFALFGYRGVTVLLVLVAAATSVLAWTTAFQVTGNASAAWFGWAAVSLSEPFFVQAFMVYPDAPAGAIVMLAIATLLLGERASTRRLIFTGMALALLPWLHTRAAILAACFGIALAARHIRRPVRVAALLTPPAISAAVWFAFFYAVYGTPDPRAPYGGAQQLALVSLPAGVVGLLFDQQFGLLPNAPVYLFAALGFIPLFKRHRRLAVELIATLAPYAIAVAAFQMWWAGYTTPARFLVAILPPLAIPAAVWFDEIRQPTSRAAAAGSLAVSVLITITVVFVDRGAMLLNFRDGASRLLVWLSPVVDVTRAVPSMFQSGTAAVASQGLVWLLGGGAVLAIAHLAVVQRCDRERQRLALGLTSVVVVMTAATLVWWMRGASPSTFDGGATTWLTAYDGDARQLAVGLSPFRRIRRADVPSRLLLVDRAPERDEPLAYLRHVPAATYAIDLTLAHAAAGRLTVALDRSLGPAWTFDVTSTATWRREITVPVASPALLVDVDPALRASIDRVTIRAMAVSGSRHRLADTEADHAARYGRALMFLLDGNAFMEPTGTWVQGGSSATFAITSEAQRPITIMVRTPPVSNHVTFDAEGWHQQVALAAGESTTIDVPEPRFRVTVASGARPADFEAGSKDVRFLGVWLEPH
jgi:hypothetical protein